MKRLIIAITGASGAIYGIRALELLRDVPDVETHAIITPAAHRTISHETKYDLQEVRELADYSHSPRDGGAALSSGSFVTGGMLVAPCSIKTLSGIAQSYNDTLVVRAADVCLKERRRVVLLLRDSPARRPYRANGTGDAQRCDHHAARASFLRTAANP
jgi:flavin prenyltransferase